MANSTAKKPDADTINSRMQGITVMTMAGQKTKYRCIVCGYIYDPDKGDPTSGILSGVEFSALPDDWVCPECGAGKDQFEEVTE